MSQKKPAESMGIDPDAQALRKEQEHYQELVHVVLPEFPSSMGNTDHDAVLQAAEDVRRLPDALRRALRCEWERNEQLSAALEASKKNADTFRAEVARLRTVIDGAPHEGSSMADSPAVGRGRYNKTRDIRIGLEIFERHGGKDCAAEHDVFYAGQGDGRALSAKEIAALYAAQWHIPNDLCRGCAKRNDVGAHADPDHNPDRGEPRYHADTCNQWAIFT